MEPFTYARKKLESLNMMNYHKEISGMDQTGYEKINENLFIYCRKVYITNERTLLFSKKTVSAARYRNLLLYVLNYPKAHWGGLFRSW